jgi:TetR/AcrR family fatty acid metabolism transcriptional regulator
MYIHSEGVDVTDIGDTFQAQVAALRRTQILDAAAQVFAERGFHRTTVHDVAKAAGVADGTIYNYFENKTALLLGILDRLNEAERRAIEVAQAQATDLRTFTHRYFQNHLLVFANQNQDLLRVVLSEVLVNAELRERYIQQIVAPTFVVIMQQLAPLAEQSRLRSGSLQLTLQLMSSMLLGLLMARMFDEQSAQSTWEQLPDVLTDLFFEGLFRE